jgi:hypothetical protein
VSKIAFPYRAISLTAAVEGCRSAELRGYAGEPQNNPLSHY